ncbi:hypothetical protein SDC9_151787 [bioreactor metagenome]|uniref:Uncharacterized protein n=1 Tax=bioreactor metagenome TaxID=1076179 RepID=A0A645ESZ4_9ZZZZ
MFTEEHTLSVTASASGIDLRRISSPYAQPFCTRAENPPIKLTPTSFAALSSVSATETYESVLHPAAAIAMGVTDILLFTTGIPYCLAISSPVFTKFSAFLVILS